MSRTYLTPPTSKIDYSVRNDKVTSQALQEIREKNGWRDGSSKHFLKTVSDGADVTFSGRVFHSHRVCSMSVACRCRGRTARFLESNPWLVLMCALVLLDTCVVVAEILLELNAMRSTPAVSHSSLYRIPSGVGLYR